jgi:hypothetical protein
MLPPRHRSRIADGGEAIRRGRRDEGRDFASRRRAEVLGSRIPIVFVQLPDDRHVVRAGVAHVGAALCAVWVIGRIGSRGAWSLGGFAATALYLLGTAVELGRREQEAR